ncbi:MAG TPA: ABC transporter ATP-binding protein [Pseudolabrys sp.]|nr:ABC transporter ATP-binding protein [Pseudolabrys sp.]
MLRIHELSSGYGPRNVLHRINLTVPERGIVTVLGANGAGKSTLMKTIVGILPPTNGHVMLNDKPLNNRTPDRALSQGVALVPERRELFTQMTVGDNLFLGGFQRRDRSCVSDDIARAVELFPILGKRMRQPAGLLSGGEQQMLAIARALISKPRVLLLDEPSLGLAPLIVDEIFEKIDGIRSEGVSVLLVEQNAAKALDIADFGYVLEVGEMKLSGTAADLANSEAVRQAYL